LPLPPPVNPNVQIVRVDSPVQSSHASKTLKTNIPQPMQHKGKTIASPSSPSDDSSKFVSSRMHLKDDCSHVIGDIRPKGSAQPKENLGKSRGDNNNQRRVAS
jgi:hypothetical protein